MRPVLWLWLRLHQDRVAPGAPQHRSGFGLRRLASTTGQAGPRSWTVRSGQPEEQRSQHKSRNRWSLPTAARLRIGEASETTITSRAAFLLAVDPVPWLLFRNGVESG